MVDYRRQGVVAVLEVNNPPVNALSKHVRQGLLDCINRADRDNAVKAVVIICKGQTFIAGADIREFDKFPGGPAITEVGQRMEAADKPVVAAIHGTALGGGLEVALFCHYRIAIKSAKVGFPEVLIGILPGAAGTQRLPRVTDITVAMEMISSGKHVPAPKALEYGILDKVVEGDLLRESISFAQSVLGKPLDPRRLSHQPVKGADKLMPAFDAAMKQIKQKQKGMISPVACLKAVRSAADLPYNKGLERERSLLTELMTGSQSAALRYAFFAERAAQKWQLPCGANSTNTKGLAVKTTGVIGAGTMGTGIAICLLRAGLPVILVEQNQKFLDKGVSTVKMMFMDAVRRKLMTEDAARRYVKNLTPAVDMQQLAGVDLVIEAVYENLALKQEIFKKLDQICKPSAILCSNTSTIDIDLIASATKRPGQVIGTHFFAPAHIMRLLENVYGKDTSPQTAATVMELGRKIGKVSVLVKTCHGFVANRMYNHWSTEAVLLLEEGALPQDVDRVLEDFGMPLGPLKVSDLSGLDVGWRIRRVVAKLEGVEITPQTRFFRGERYCPLADKLYDLGRLGRKTGAGWYRYDKPGGRVAMADEDVEAVIKKHSADMGIERQVIPSQEILERCVYSAINEGFRILEMGVAARPEDIDVIWLYGFSFPRFMGGPMFYASQVGLAAVYERICYYHKNFPYSSYWVPSDLLRKLASSPKPVPIGQWMSFSASKL
ncbi:peroxisomal bifunctional enzyme-like [Babylonia areolata]|uniref:peroxisomal bifunctional enzyme-like n=1 Tax=Babylonia areolata TaxID=304850 RepID=UPI003FCF662B